MVINICLVIAIILVLIILFGYNKLVKQKNKVKQYESGIDVILNQRFDLIPNIVECVKSYSNYESETLTDLVNARTAYNQEKGVNFKDAERIENKINRIMAVAENYPDLKANKQYLDLQDKLSQIENKLQQARNMYNNAVTIYNTTIETIPSNIIAKIFVFEKAELFKIDENKKENINVNINQ